MLTARLIQLIETHSDAIARDTMKEILTDERTRSFARLHHSEGESRIASLYHNLGKWIARPNDEAVRDDYETWGRRRFQQGIPLSEIVCCLILAKSHLRRYIRDHGLLEFRGDTPASGELLPVQLYALQELNYKVGEFFDKALYYLVLGYEAEAAAQKAAA